ncbi:hypothetical protein MNBD_BACTEROID05-757 [hydrothermal vent metagenome]|uniref:Porin n=1 Tax=hydrothermal vent metagenome TaxID=652676 RepID=A0A3B0T8E0_9ZZZZ
MKVVRSVVSLMIVSMLIVPASFAGEIDDLKSMVSELRQDYESKIQMLESKIKQLETTQDQKVVAKVEELREEMQTKIKKGAFNVEYVGRDHNSPVGKGGFMIETPSGNSKVSLGGYMDFEFENFQNTDSTFDQYRYIINVGAQIGERLRFYSEYEIEHGGPGQGGTAEIEQATVDFLINDLVNFRGGALLIPFGRTNLYHDSDLRDLASRPLVARDIIPTTWTETGAGFFGEFEPIIGEYEDLLVNYEVYAINGLSDGFSDTGTRGARGSLETDNNNSKAVVGRVVASPFLGHEVGFSGYWGKYNNLDDNIKGLGIDYLSNWGPLELVGEYARFYIDEPVPAVGRSTDVAKTIEGYRVQANYHFWPKFLNGTFLARSFEDPTFTLVSRYGWARIDDDADANSGTNEEKRYTLGLNYRPVESWVFKLEYQWNETENEALERGDNDGFLWSIAMGF